MQRVVLVLLLLALLFIIPFSAIASSESEVQKRGAYSSI